MGMTPMKYAMMVRPDQTVALQDLLDRTSFRTVIGVIATLAETRAEHARGVERTEEANELEDLSTQLFGISNTIKI